LCVLVPVRVTVCHHGTCPVVVAHPDKRGVCPGVDRRDAWWFAPSAPGVRGYLVVECRWSTAAECASPLFFHAAVTRPQGQTIRYNGLPCASATTWTVGLWSRPCLSRTLSLLCVVSCCPCPLRDQPVSIGVVRIGIPSRGGLFCGRRRRAGRPRSRSRAECSTCISGCW
jgi:hypothetical protein